ncbi:hypothetical protein [Enterococcus ureilyticus]|uniref:hypothetical protein n=1 Tax=Enterococcus ureilyticus TaxID=1131292 RepID=UPI00114C9126|nr:hypothetical protein [Enterococcus ureilyticus]MBM7690560.1 hypothetical protein [Enterococcus ureilyticus]
MTSFKKIAEYLSSCFTPSVIQELSHKSNLIQRKRTFTIDHLLWLFVFQEKNIGESSLTDMCASLWEKFGVRISPEGLNQRFDDHSEQFLALLFQYILEKQQPDLAVIKHAYSPHFRRIRLLDSTAFQLPNRFSDQYLGLVAVGKKHP